MPGPHQSSKYLLIHIIYGLGLNSLYVQMEIKLTTIRKDHANHPGSDYADTPLSWNNQGKQPWIKKNSLAPSKISRNPKFRKFSEDFVRIEI